jgi:hypothetical protein
VQRDGKTGARVHSERYDWTRRYPLITEAALRTAYS